MQLSRLFGRLRLGTKLILMVLSMMTVTLSMLFATYTHYERVLLEEVENQTEAMSKALEIAVEHLTSKGQTDPQFLENYIQRLSKRGVTEVSILSTERTVLASSDQAKVGKKVHVKRPPSGPKPFLITGTIGDDEDQNKKISSNLEIPIIVDDQKAGYLRLRVVLDDVAALLRSMYIKRMIATSAVFLAGVGASLLLAWRMTAPLSRLASAAERVGSGDLDVSVEVGDDIEIGKVQSNFNAMVSKLREKRRLESQLRRAERAGAIGRLASAVAHEIRNPLNYINLSVDHLKASFRPADAEVAREFEESANQIKEELHRVNSLVTDFLNYGRPPRLRIQSCRLEDVLSDIARFTSPKADEKGVKLEVAFEPGFPSVAADPEAIRTCVLNLVTNALQAMPGSGTIRMEASPLSADTVELRISDDGPGIAEANLERIFEPYFSTKEAGVGLGLAITQRLVHEHGGDIRATSRPGETVFRIHLPVNGPEDFSVPERSV